MYKRILNRHFLERLTPVIGGGRSFMPAILKTMRPPNVTESVLNKYRAFLSRFYFRKEADRWRFSRLALEFALPFIMLKKGFSRVAQKITRQISPVSFIFKNYLGQERPARSQSQTALPAIKESQAFFLREHPLFLDSSRRVVYNNIGMRIIERFQQGALPLTPGPERNDSAGESPGANLQFRTPAPPATVQDTGIAASGRINLPGPAPSGASSAALLAASVPAPARQEVPNQSPVALKYRRFSRAAGIGRMPENLQKNSFQYPAPGGLYHAVTKNLRHSLDTITKKYSPLQRDRKTIEMEQKFVQRKSSSETTVDVAESVQLLQNIYSERTMALTHKISDKQSAGESAAASQNRRGTKRSGSGDHPTGNKSDAAFIAAETEAPAKLPRPPGISDPRGNPANGEPDVNRIAETVYTLIEKKLRTERERRGIFF